MNDIADVNTDAEFDPLMLWHGSVLLGHAALDVDRTAHRINGAGELDQHAVTRRLDDAAPVGGDRGIDQGLSRGLQPGQGTFLVSSHQPAVPGDFSARTAANRRSGCSVAKGGPPTICKIRPRSKHAGLSPG